MTRNKPKSLILRAGTLAAALACGLAYVVGASGDADAPNRRRAAERAPAQIALGGPDSTGVDSTGTSTPEEDSADHGTSCNPKPIRPRRILAEFTRLLKCDGVGSDAVLRHSGALFEAMRRSDEAVAAVGDRLRDPECDDAEASMLLSLLSAANTGAARNAFLAYLHDGSVRPIRREVAAVYVEQIQEPGTEFDEALVAIAREPGRLGGNALLALASLGNRIRGEHPARAERIANLVSRALRRADDDEGRRLALLALGNLGGSRAPQAALVQLGSVDPSLRSAAVQSLCRIRDPKVAGTLERAAREDSSPDVRRLALEVLLQRVAENRTDTSGARDSLQRLLQQVAQTDGDPHIRSWAARQAKTL